jgi:hypothetical protein
MKNDIESLKQFLASASDELEKGIIFASRAKGIIDEALSMACEMSVKDDGDDLISKYIQRKGSQN